MDEVMDIFQDYEAWKHENYDLIWGLVKKKSKTISRFAPVLAVVDYLSEQKHKREINEDEELIFSTGFDFIYDQFHLIQTILELKFDKNIEEMEKYSQTINLLLFINEFQSEVLSAPIKDKSGIQMLDDLEDKVDVCLDKKENAPDEYFLILDEVTRKIFDANGIEVNLIDQIFYEIAVEYGIYSDENEFDMYNAVIQKQILKHRK